MSQCVYSQSVSFAPSVMLVLVTEQCIEAVTNINCAVSTPFFHHLIGLAMTDLAVSALALDLFKVSYLYTSSISRLQKKVDF